MNKFKKYLLVFLLFAAAQVQAQSKSETEVMNAVEQLRQLMINPDSSRLARIVSDKLSYGHSSGLIEDKAAFVNALVSGKSDFVRIDLSNQTVQVSDKAAIVRHQLDADINDNNKPAKVKLAILTVWQKEKGQWKLLARQAVRLAQ